jgi:hypothetical protein
MVKDFEVAGEAPGTGSVRIIDWKVEHRIGVKASPQVIWDILVDLPGWSAWNPLYPEARGDVRIGQALDLVLALPGAAPRRIRPMVVDWVPREQLHWRTTALGGLVRTLRYVEIEELAPGSCIVSNGEIFKGLLGTTVLKSQASKLRAGFAAMGVALRDAAEARWRSRDGTTT